MIQINLLPPEYRPRTGTPVARFAAIVVGMITVTDAFLGGRFVGYGTKVMDFYRSSNYNKYFHLLVLEHHVTTS